MTKNDAAKKAADLLDVERQAKETTDNVISYHLHRDFDISHGIFVRDENGKPSESGLNQVTWTFANLAEAFKRPQVSEEKEGAYLTQGRFKGKRRKDDRVLENSLMIFDFDKGGPLEDLEQEIIDRGYSAVIHTTHSHLKTESKISKADWKRVNGELSPDPDLLEKYLLDSKGYHPAVVNNVALTNEDEKHFSVSHAPQSKCRVAFPLKEPYDFTKRSREEWNAYYIAVGQSFGFEVDSSCQNPARIFYTPRTNDPDNYVCIPILSGRPVDLDDFEPAVEETKQQRRTSRLRQRSKAEIDARKEEDGKAKFLYHGDFCLNKWAARTNWGFELEKALTKFAPDDVIRSGRGPKDPGAHIMCPFDDEHGNSGDKSDEACFVVNASDNVEYDGRFRVDCRHDSCQSREQLEFIQRMLVLEWFPESALNDSSYLFSANYEGEHIFDLADLKKYEKIEEAWNDVDRLQKNDRELAKQIYTQTQISGFEKEYQKKILNAIARRVGLPKKAIYSATPACQDGYELEVLKGIVDFNRSHAYVKLGGSTKILDESNLEKIDFMNRPDFDALYANKIHYYVNSKDELKQVPYTKYWKEWKNRRTYFGVEFEPDPKKHTPRYYNLWKGWQIEGDPDADWSLLRDHIYENICLRNEEYFNWLMTWMADMFQYPGRKLGSAVVLRGKKGVGKSKLFEWLSNLMGSYAMGVSNERHMTGNFNAHMVRLILMVCEETLYAGNHSGNNVLKDIITRDEMPLERKGVDVQQVSNYTRFGLTSNEGWVVPATEDERRFFVLDVGDTKEKDKPYFAAIDDQMEAGGDRAMVHELMHWVPPFDEGWDILRSPPKTAALEKQVSETYEPWDSFFYNLISWGEVPEKEGVIDYGIYLNEERETILPVCVLREHFNFSMKEIGTQAAKRKMNSQTTITEQVRKWLFVEKAAERESLKGSYYAALREGRPPCYKTLPLKDIRERHIKEGRIF